MKFKNMKDLILEKEGNNYFERNKSHFEANNYVSEEISIYDKFIESVNPSGGGGGKYLKMAFAWGII